MPDENSVDGAENIKDEVASGEYFSQARAWYSEMFFAPIAQSNLFKVSATISCFAALAAFVSCMSILPITNRTTIPVSTPNIDETASQSIKLAKKGYTADQTILEFFVKEYVHRRESYSFHSYRKNRAFVKVHSDPITFKAYDSAFNVNNPRSPAAVLGERGERVVRITGYGANIDIQPPVATVNFEVTIRGKQKQPKSYWTASFAFYYDSLVVTEVTDPETGALTIKTQDPVFNVVKYVVSENNNAR